MTASGGGKVLLVEAARTLRAVEGPAPRAGRAPAHLRRDTKRLWRTIRDEYELQEHHVRLLTLMCEALDRCSEAREAIAKEGLLVEGRFGPRSNPAAAIERDSRLAAARLLS